MTDVTADETKGRISPKWHRVAALTLALAALTAVSVLLLRPSSSPSPNAVTPAVVPPPKVSDPGYSAQELAATRERFWALKGEAAICAKRFVDSYQNASYEYCEFIDAGKNIGGGCAHLTGGAYLDAPLLNAAMVHCNVGK